MNILISNSSDKPIYEQIELQIKNYILTGVLEPGEALPSIRYLAKELRISVITTKRAYEELERDGFIETVAGKGSYVSTQNRELLREEHYRRIEEFLGKAAEEARSSGITKEEMMQMLDIIYDAE